jgi:hypothetical protein
LFDALNTLESVMATGLAPSVAVATVVPPLLVSRMVTVPVDAPLMRSSVAAHSS